MCVQILLIAHTVCTNSLNSTQCVCVCINSLKNTQPDLIGSADIAAAALTSFLILDHIITGAVCNEENLGTLCVCN